MRVAVTYKGGEVFQHFGHSTHFKLYDIEDGHVVGAHLVPVNGGGHSALAGFLSMFKVDELICGGMGQGARDALAEIGIKVYAGVSGKTDDAIAALIAGTLDYDNDKVCEDHDHDHSCGEHDCCGEHDSCH